MSRPPTSVDVARLSGVSQPTVSYVLNATPGKRISEATRERVLQAAADLGYTPSSAAQTLARGHSGVVVLNAPPGPDTSIAAGYNTALSQRLGAAGWTLLSHYPPPENAREHLLRLVQATGAGAVLDAFGDQDTLEALRRRGVAVIPLIPPEAWEMTIVGPVELQLEHLTALGHRRIALASPTTPVEVAATEGRASAADAWLAERGLPLTARLRWTGDLEQLTRDVREAVGTGITAVAAHNDDTAIPVLAAAAASGLSIPGDIAVIGVDDAPLARLMVPPLSTVRYVLDAATLEATADRLIAALRGQSPSSHESEPRFELIVRRST